MYFNKADHYFSFYELFGDYLQELHIVVDQIPNLQKCFTSPKT